MPTMRWTPALVALAVLAGGLAVAGTAAASHTCVALVGAAPVGVADGALGTIRLCDETGDGDPDTVKLETYPAYSESQVTVERSTTTNDAGQDETVAVEASTSGGGALDPYVFTRQSAEDHGDNERVDDLRSELVLEAGGPVDQRARTFLGVWDFGGDGLPDAYGFLLCANGLCEAPTPGDVPVSGPPNVAFYVTGVGWVP
jgi:hypothetical protein